MNFDLSAARLALLAVAAGTAAAQTAPHPKVAASYLGFDRNDYPGDAVLPVLRKTFRYTSYWLNNPPGESSNSWTGKRAILRQQGFGFLVLFTGRADAAIKGAMAIGQSAQQLGADDGRAAASAAMREGFPKNVLIFLDQEEGGRLLEEQAAYLFAWVNVVRAAGARAGVYCSGIDVSDGSGTITSAQDIAERESSRVQSPNRSEGKTPEPLAIWIANDQCPPSPGCVLTAPSLSVGVPESLLRSTSVWQYAQSPRRAQFSAHCPTNQAADGNCYAPGLPASAPIFVDLNTAKSPDPSGGSF